MAQRYTSQPGDTLDTLSRRFYGTGNGARRIRAANPGLSDPIQPGTVLAIPADPAAVPDKPQPLPATDVDEVALLIDGERFRFWESAAIVRHIDAPAVVNFSSPFDPQDDAFRRLFRPFSYRSLEVAVGGDTLFTGTLVNPTPSLDDTAQTVAVDGYSLPGVLQDVSPPEGMWPVEYEGLTLRDIAADLIEPFGIGAVFDAPPGPPFERVAINPEQNIWQFLMDLARERGLIMSSNARGDLTFGRSVTPGSPVARLEQGQPPVISVTATFRPQEYYSHVTAIEPSRTGTGGSRQTVRNPLAEGILRPYNFEVRDAEGGDVLQAAEAKLGRMLANAVSYDMDVATLRDPQGNLWEPNTTLTLRAPGAMIYSEYEFLVRKVTMNRDSDRAAATLQLILPGAFSGEAPEAMPWD